MAMNFEEMDDITRGYMLQEFEPELRSSNPYVSKALSAKGRDAFPDLMRKAIQSGNEESLTADLAKPDYWHPTETYERDGVVRERRRNIRQASERLALTEFNTWYVRGFAKRLMEEGVTRCQAYRAAQPKWEPAECSVHEGQIFQVEQIYNGHRARYWPTDNPNAVSIPFGPGCHHTIRRVPEDR
ncbi:MAG TPA: hypothetical protein VMY35_09035 [Phycisphaerae bacterium]|nr:hypothetical protein [Phycisphaerae bacterium]